MCQFAIQNILTTGLLNTGANISVVWGKFFRPFTAKLLKVCMHKVTSASGANLGPIAQCDLTSRLGNKQFTDRLYHSARPA